MPLNDYELGGTVVVRGAKLAARQLGKVHKVSRRVWGGFQKIARVGMRTLRFAFRRVGLAAIALTGVLGGSLKVWADFSLQMAKIGTLLDDGRTAMRRFGGEVRRLSMDTGQGTDVVAEGMFQALSAGVSAADATKFMGVAAQAGVAGFTDLNVAVDGLTNVMNAYGLKSDEARKISDAFFVANKFGKTTFQELANFMGTAAPMASALGISYQDLLASIISITKAGVSTNEAFTQISGIMTDLISKTPQFQKAVKDQLGVTFGPEAIKEYGGFVGFMEKLGASVRGNVTTFRKLFPNVRAFRAVLRLTSEGGVRDLVDGLSEIDKGGGLTAAKFREVSETIGFQLKQLKQIGIDAFRSLGGAMVAGLGLDLGRLVKSLRNGLPRFQAAATEFFAGLRGGFLDTWPQVKASWKAALLSMGEAGETLFKQLDLGFGSNTGSAKSWGRTVGTVIGQAIKQFGDLIAKVDELVKGLINAFNSAKTTWGAFHAGFAAVIPGMSGPGDPNAGKLPKGQIVDKNAIAKRVIQSRFPGITGDALERAAAAAARGKLTGNMLGGSVIDQLKNRNDPALGGFTFDEVAKRMNVAVGRLTTEERQAADAAAHRRANPATAPRKRITLADAATATVAKGRELFQGGKSLVQGHGVILGALGRTIADAVGERPWELFFKMENKTEVDNGDGNLDLGGGGSGSVDHHERGAGSAIAEFRFRQKYLVTEGAIRSVPHEFVAVKGSGASGGAALL